MMDERMKREQMFGGVAEAMENKRYSFKEAIELYYGEPKLTEEEEKVVDEMLKEIEESGFLEKCKEIAREKERERERKIIHIGRLKISRVAGLIFLVCFISVFGVTAYAAVMSHIRRIEVNEMGDHSEVAVDYNPENEEELSAIETYYKPAWIPDGYYLDSEEKYVNKYRLIYISDTGEDQIVYYQTLPSVKVHYSTEDGLSEKVAFGQYSGEYIETDSSNYLIVTDGAYIYSLIADTASKKELIKILAISKKTPFASITNGNTNAEETDVNPEGHTNIEEDDIKAAWDSIEPGLVDVDELPEFIPVVAKDGTTGYIKTKDVIKIPKTIEEALKMTENAYADQVLPLYNRDGEVIGEIVNSYGDTEEMGLEFKASSSD